MLTDAHGAASSRCHSIPPALRRHKARAGTGEWRSPDPSSMGGRPTPAKYSSPETYATSLTRPQSTQGCTSACACYMQGRGRRWYGSREALQALQALLQPERRRPGRGRAGTTPAGRGKGTARRAGRGLRAGRPGRDRAPCVRPCGPEDLGVALGRSHVHRAVAPGARLPHVRRSCRC